MHFSISHWLSTLPIIDIYTLFDYEKCLEYYSSCCVYTLFLRVYKILTHFRSLRVTEEIHFDITNNT